MAFGGAIVVIAATLVLLGPTVLPGAGAVSATIDSEMRFQAVFFLAYGTAILWFGRRWRDNVREICALLAIFFIGGIARLISLIAAGPPDPFFVAMTSIELLFPLLMAGLGVKALREHSTSLC
jgi:peptidoglycan/LPS O-acetylase OafA/YrhL